MPHVDLSVPAPILLPNTTGNRVIGVQWIPKDFKWRDQFGGEALVRVLVVDLEKLAVTATRDLPATEMRFAVGPDELYVADTAGSKIRALSLTDLSDVRETPLTQKVEDLLVVADKLLCSGDGKLRLDLPDLGVSKTWSPIGPDTRAFPVEGGWHLDGIIYDQTLSRARMLVGSPIHNAGFGAYRLWGASANSRRSDAANQPINEIVGGDYPISIAVRAPTPLVSSDDIPIRVTARHIGHEVIVEALAGVMPRDFLVQDGGQARWNTARMVNPNFHPLTKSFVGASHPFLPVTTSGHRAMVVVDGRLAVWNLDENLLKALTGPFRFQLDQTISVEFDQPTTLTDTPLGGTAPFEVRPEGGGAAQTLEYVVSPKAEIEAHGVERFFNNYLNSYNVRSGDDVEKRRNLTAPFVERLLGRPPRGLLYTRRRAIKATDSSQPTPATAELGYYVLYEIPESLYKPNFDSRFATLEKRAAASAKRSEKERVARQRQHDENEAGRAKQESQRFYAAIWKSWWPVATPFVLAIPVWWALIRTRSRSRRWRRYFGVLTAALGLAPLLSLLAISLLGAVFGLFRMSNATFASFLPGAFLFLALMLITGTVDVAATKGYSVVLGFVLGLVAPIGLLVMILLPDRLEEPRRPPGESGSVTGQRR